MGVKTIKNLQIPGSQYELYHVDKKPYRVRMDGNVEAASDPKGVGNKNRFYDLMLLKQKGLAQWIVRAEYGIKGEEIFNINYVYDCKNSAREQFHSLYRQYTLTNWGETQSNKPELQKKYPYIVKPNQGKRAVPKKGTMKTQYEKNKLQCNNGFCFVVSENETAASKVEEAKKDPGEDPLMSAAFSLDFNSNIFAEDTMLTNDDGSNLLIDDLGDINSLYPDSEEDNSTLAGILDGSTSIDSFVNGSTHGSDVDFDGLSELDEASVFEEETKEEINVQLSEALRGIQKLSISASKAAAALE